MEGAQKLSDIATRFDAVQLPVYAARTRGELAWALLQLANAPGMPLEQRDVLKHHASQEARHAQQTWRALDAEGGVDARLVTLLVLASSTGLVDPLLASEPVEDPSDPDSLPEDSRNPEASSHVPKRSRRASRPAQIVALLRQRLSDKEIAAQLGISTRTAEGHVARLMAQQGVSSRYDVK